MCFLHNERKGPSHIASSGGITRTDSRRVKSRGGKGPALGPETVGNNRVLRIEELTLLKRLVQWQHLCSLWPSGLGC